ncbi:hypothetical protein [Haloterrigena salifodinae]|uniref:hypothetical protein n=1 Tax=Haloterrigena salifodinae TaxID=2675099 RepID=UPI000F878A92|nr:hypothetical protein [Haloterrigena salifodinae]
MERVSAFVGVAYGFSLLGYLVAVLGFGLLVSALGAGFLTGGQSDGSFVIGGFIFLLGAGSTVAGLLGMLYKVIADGVAAGIENAVATPASRPARESDDGSPRSR